MQQHFALSTPLGKIKLEVLCEGTSKEGKVINILKKGQKTPSILFSFCLKGLFR